MPHDNNPWHYVRNRTTGNLVNDPITLNRIPLHRAIELNKMMYNARSMQDMLNRSANRRVPHSRRLLTRAEIERIARLAVAEPRRTVHRRPPPEVIDLTATSSNNSRRGRIARTRSLNSTDGTRGRHARARSRSRSRSRNQQPQQRRRHHPSVMAWVRSLRR